MSRIRDFAREVVALRKEIVAGIPEDDPGASPVTITLPAEQMAVVIYALGSTWLSEAIARQDGYETLLNAIGRASSELMEADLGVQVDEAINKILGCVNPEEDGDGA